MRKNRRSLSVLRSLVRICKICLGDVLEWSLWWHWVLNVNGIPFKFDPALCVKVCSLLTRSLLPKCHETTQWWAAQIEHFILRKHCNLEFAHARAGDASCKWSLSLLWSDRFMNTNDRAPGLVLHLPRDPSPYGSLRDWSRGHHGLRILHPVSEEVSSNSICQCMLPK